MNKRLKFFKNHFLLSIFICFIIAVWFLLIWYPFPLNRALGVTTIIGVMILVDIVIGPLLCFIIYNEAKKSLKFDLIIIITLQFAAMSYGVFYIEQGRPVWIAFNVDRFEVIRKNEIYNKNIKNTLAQYQNPSWLKPQYVGVVFASNTEEKNQNMFDEVLGGISIAQRPERYVPLEKVSAEIQSRSKQIKELNDYNDKDTVRQTLKKYPDANAWLPLKASSVDMVVLINKEKAEVVKIVDLRPWN